MGIYDRQYYREEPKGFTLDSVLGGRSVVMTLIMINVAVFILDALSQPADGTGTGAVSAFLSLSKADVAQPWYWFRFLTYGFAHGGPSHIFGNMIGLFFFGRAAESVYGSRKFLWMYLTAILGGGIIWIVTAMPAVGRGAAVLGASGGVVAVVILFCLHFPHQKVYLLFLPFFGFPAWVLGLLYVGGDLLGMFGVRHGNVAFVVHLAGAAYAYFFFRTQWELSQLWQGSSAGSFSISRLVKRKPHLRVHNPGEPRRDDQLAAKADEILEKLHQQGEASLTARERKILEDYSRSIKQRNR